MDIFYKIPKNKKIIKELIHESVNDCVKLSLEIKDNSYKRILSNKTFEEVFDLFLKSPMHWVFIKRSGEIIYSPIKETPYYEIGGCTMGLEYDEFMFIYVKESIGNKLIEKYKLKTLHGTKYQ